MNSTTIPTITIALIKAAAKHTGLDAKKIHSFKSLYAADKPIMIARWAVMHVMHADLGIGLPNIGKAFAMDDGPVRHAVRRAEARTDEEFLALVEALREALTNVIV
jgi:hypothetical protein